MIENNHEKTLLGWSAPVFENMYIYASLVRYNRATSLGQI